MKLKQALEKAKLMRGDTTASRPEVVSRPLERRVAGSEWKAPVYSESNRVELEHAALMANRCVCIEPDAPALEYYKVLRTKIQHLMRSKGWNTVMIASPRESEGKTLTAINLALTFAKSYNQTVMLVDCDLRRQCVHRTLGLDSPMGLVDFLVDEKPLKDFIVWPGIDKLTLISGGRSVQNSAELLGSTRMKSLVQELKSRYEDRTLIFDTAPVLVNADAIALSPLVDAILLVVDEGKTGLRDIRKTISSLPQEKILGYVLNRQKRPGTKTSGYYY
jgi:non-specific protein-tyrosine kinase